MTESVRPKSDGVKSEAQFFHLPLNSPVAKLWQAFNDAVMPCHQNAVCCPCQIPRHRGVPAGHADRSHFDRM